MKKNLFKYVKMFLPFIGIVILALIIFNLNPAEIKKAFLSIKPIFIVISLSLTVPRILLRNYAWQCILKEQKIKLGYFQSLKIFLIGYFYGILTPGYIGNLMRIPYMKEKTDEPYGKLFVNVVIEPIIHTLTLYGMIFIGALLVLEKFPELLKLIIGWIIILAIILIYFIKKERGEKLFYTLIKYFIPKSKKGDFNRFVHTFYADFPKLSKLVLPLILGFFTWVIIFTQFYIFVLALDLPIPFIHFLLLFTVANVVSFIPISFAGLGTREATAFFIFPALYRVEGTQILVVSLMGFLVTDVFLGSVGFLLSLTEAREKVQIKAAD